MGVVGASGAEREHAMSMHWLAHLFPKEAIRIDAASIAHEGWVWKRSRHLGLWRKRWMVLTIDRHLLTFEDDNQRSGATDHFSLTSFSSRPLSLPAKMMLSDDQGEVVRPVEVEVAYPSKRVKLLRNFGMYSDAEDGLRAMTCSFDAGEKGNREWTAALQNVFSRRADYQSMNNFDQLPDPDSSNCSIDPCPQLQGHHRSNLTGDA